MFGQGDVQLDDETVIPSVGAADAVALEKRASPCVRTPTHEHR
jgi:hypothetical protein